MKIGDFQSRELYGNGWKGKPWFLDDNSASLVSANTICELVLWATMA